MPSVHVRVDSSRLGPSDGNTGKYRLLRPRPTLRADQVTFWEITQESVILRPAGRCVGLLGAASNHFAEDFGVPAGYLAWANGLFFAFSKINWVTKLE
jgi:hypothetical protein